MPFSRALTVLGAPALALAVAAGVVTALPQEAASTEPLQVRQGRPNIVVIMVDDLRDDELGGPWLRTTRQRIGGSGVRFRSSFSPLPLCCPARASFLTGKYAHNHEVWSHNSPYGFHAFNDRRTLPVWLNRAGYRTAYLGKYLNGYGIQNPYDGDDRPPVKDGSSRRYVPPGWDDWRASLDGRGGTYNYLRTHLSDQGNGVTSLDGRYQTHAYGDIAARMIDRHVSRRQPVFFMINFTAPHHGQPREPDDPMLGRGRLMPTPAVPANRRGAYNRVIYRSPGRGEASVRDKPASLRRAPLTPRHRRAIREATRQRAEAMSVVDQQVDRIISALRRTGELDNTFVVFTSDNGFLLGEHRIRHGKLLPWDPALRVPTLVRGPGIPPGRIRRDPIATIDWAPTILAMARVRQPSGFEIDGVSMLGVARNGDRGWSRAIGTESGAKGRRAGRQRGIRTPRYLYTAYRGGAEELYDLRIDPRQNCNLLARLRIRRADQDCRAAGGTQPLGQRYRRALDALRDVRQEFDPAGPGPGCAGLSCRRLLLPEFLQTRPVPPPRPTWYRRG